MIISTYYNQVNQVLLLSKNNKQVTHFDKDNNLIKLYNKADLIGINILNFKKPGQLGLLNSKEIDRKYTSLLTDRIENPLIVGYVSKIDGVEGSSKLKKCQVNIGDKDLQIICGANNIQKDIKVIVAKVGCIMPNGVEIKKSKVLSVESDGMICSLTELGLSQEKNQGIAVLGETYIVGSDYIS